MVEEEERRFRFTTSAQGQMKQVNTTNSDGTIGAIAQKNGFRGDALRAWKEDASGNRTYFYTTAGGRLKQTGKLKPSAR